MFYRNMALSKSENSALVKEFETYNAAFMGNYCVTNMFCFCFTDCDVVHYTSIIDFGRLRRLDRG